MEWGLKHTAIAGIVLSAGQILSVIQFVYPRTEGEKLEKTVLSLQTEIVRVDAKHDLKADRLYDKMEEVRKEISILVELQKRR